ncbi:MAG: hypothetical protein JSR98_06685 [Proteobacteria bacterium]|nr:hypothetical protein [Pseudomonadota bacterium]
MVFAKAQRRTPLATEIRPNDGAKLVDNRCEDTDEVVGHGNLHVEQMDARRFWARLSVADGPDVVMWFSSKSKITLTAELEE